NLLAAGIDVVGFDIAAKPDFVAAGGRLLRSPAEIADAADIVLHSLPDVAALNQVVDGLAGRCGPQHVIADLSASPLAEKMAARDRLAAAGACLLDCQITGSPEMLVEHRGVIFASGDRAAAARCEPVFAAAVARYVFVGAFGAATKLKQQSSG